MIKIPDLMHLRIELEGGFKTDPKYLLFIRTVKHNHFSVFNLSGCNHFVVFSLVKILSRWQTETWPLGVEYSKPGRAGGAKLFILKVQ